MSKQFSTPFRHDYVGSFLRPAELKKARQEFADGTISHEELKAVEMPASAISSPSRRKPVTR